MLAFERCHYIWDIFERGAEPGTYVTAKADLHDCTHIDLRESDLTSDMVEALAKALHQNTKCTSCDSDLCGRASSAFTVSFNAGGDASHGYSCNNKYSSRFFF